MPRASPNRCPGESRDPLVSRSCVGSVDTGFRRHDGQSLLRFIPWSDSTGLLDKLHLRAVRTLDPADMVAIVFDLFKNARAVLAQLRERPGIVVGLHRDMFDAEMLV